MDDSGKGAGENPPPRKWEGFSASIPAIAGTGSPPASGGGFTPPTTHARSGDVVVVGVEIPFWSLVGLLVKLSLAAIPAAIILALIYAVIGGFLISAITAAFYHSR